MATLFLLLVTIGAAPLIGGVILSRRRLRDGGLRVQAGSVILCALAFNLTFLWQELWLVIPKTLTPGLHPILYHNDHEWTGHAPTVELLQGSGALVTLGSGLAFSAGLAMARRAGPTWRCFLFWMAVEGLYQSMTQLAIGTQLAGNDVGRALAYLAVGAEARWALLALSVGTMALIGVGLSRLHSLRRAPEHALNIAASAMLAVVPILAFRVPRDIVEVALIPVFVNLAIAGWLTIGAAITTAPEPAGNGERVAVVGPAIALCLTLLFFQIVLRPGIAF